MTNPAYDRFGNEHPAEIQDNHRQPCCEYCDCSPDTRKYAAEMKSTPIVWGATMPGNARGDSAIARLGSALVACEGLRPAGMGRIVVVCSAESRSRRPPAMTNEAGVAPQLVDTP